MALHVELKLLYKPCTEATTVSYWPVVMDAVVWSCVPLQVIAKKGLCQVVVVTVVVVVHSSHAEQALQLHIVSQVWVPLDTLVSHQDWHSDRMALLYSTARLAPFESCTFDAKHIADMIASSFIGNSSMMLGFGGLLQTSSECPTKHFHTKLNSNIGWQR